MWAGRGAWPISGFSVISSEILILGIGTCNMKKILDFFYILWYFFQKVQNSSIKKFTKTKTKRTINDDALMRFIVSHNHDLIGNLELIL